MKHPFKLLLWWFLLFLSFYWIGIVPSPDHKSELTLKQAYQLGLHKAHSWNPHAQLVEITSVDDSEKNMKGSKGTRNSWQLLFAVPHSDQASIVSIYKNKISQFKEIEETVQPNDIISPEQIIFDSVDLIQKAQTQYHLQPGQTSWAEGYHFILFKNEEKLFFTVVGRDQNNNFTKVYFDPITGRYLGSVSKK